MSAHPSLADALAFDAFTEEQKRIAIAGVALRNRLDELKSAARQEGFDAGLQAASDEKVQKIVDHYEDALADVWARLRLLLSTFAAADSRATMLREITAVVDAASKRPK